MVVSPKNKENKIKTNYNKTIKHAPSLSDKTTLTEKSRRVQTESDKGIANRARYLCT
jgi:hypothetical protein